eukprot:5854269-Pyramimonas_sp.AAC.1
MLPPWKLVELVREPAAGAIACPHARSSKGPANWPPVSEAHPLATCNQFVAGCVADEVDMAQDPTFAGGFCAAHGVLIAPTVAD